MPCSLGSTFFWTVPVRIVSTIRMWVWEAVCWRTAGLHPSFADWLLLASFFSTFLFLSKKGEEDFSKQRFLRFGAPGFSNLLLYIRKLYHSCNIERRRIWIPKAWKTLENGWYHRREQDRIVMMMQQRSDVVPTPLVWYHQKMAYLAVTII